VYCRSSTAAQRAIKLLQDKAGFIGATLYNGLGTSNWTDAGYPLVRSNSYQPPCSELGLTDVTEEDARQSCPTFFNRNNAINSIPAEETLKRQKTASERNCESLAIEQGTGRGGAAGVSKDCSGQGSGGQQRERKQRQIRGL
jgi:hypothetical protein